MVNVNFNYYEDTPDGDDPDRVSETLNQHHQILWSKRLPNGEMFDLKRLTENGKLLLQHKSEMGDFILSSDTIVHSLFYSDHENKSFSDKIAYSKFFPCGEIKSEIPNVIMDFWKREYGIACYTIFPVRPPEGQTINCARGCYGKIRDRFDLTLECIRRFYEKSTGENPLRDALNRYKKFFGLFDSFSGYVSFFHFQDLVEPDGTTVKFWLPFDDFNRPPLPQSSKEYRDYKENVCEFIEKRRKRISEACSR